MATSRDKTRSAARTSIVLFNRDLRTHDHPALSEACGLSTHVVPLFVLDPAIAGGPLASPNRLSFLHESLADLRTSLRALGGDLVVRTGDTVEECMKIAEAVGAERMFVSADVSATACSREERLASACHRARRELVLCEGVTVVPPDRPTTTTGTPFKVFTPFWRAWSRQRWRDLAPRPDKVSLPSGIAPGRLPPVDVTPSLCSPERALGGETRARALLQSFIGSGLEFYDAKRDLLAANGTSRLSPYLHFGCVSPLETALLAAAHGDGDGFVRQLGWRDFHHHTTLFNPKIGSTDLRPARGPWRSDPLELDAWQTGQTGYPIVDAGMRQLLREGWMHNRARMITASFLTRRLGHDWREGQAHFARWLVDGDVANNAANWQWVAGTGRDTRPNRILNPLRQAERFDPDGTFVRTYVPELAQVPTEFIHTPWLLPRPERRQIDYPAPIALESP